MEQSRLYKLIVAQLVKTFHDYHGTRSLFPCSKTAHHRTIIHAISIRATTSHPITLKYILTLPLHLILGLHMISSLQFFRLKFLYISYFSQALYVPRPLVQVSSDNGWTSEDRISVLSYVDRDIAIKSKKLEGKTVIILYSGKESKSSN